ncbi:MAG TPA: zf-TFIIB domain-containing protein [Candidatus Binatia bacterium]|nr:zf-TFIIB domain-containing protein [Candidatus Binatia bacterium]
MEHGGDEFPEKLEQKERAEEDLFFARRDRMLVEQARARREDRRRRRLQALVRMRCPDCGAQLVSVKHHGVAVEECPAGHGLWMTRAELHTLARRERDSWIGRYFYRPRPLLE